MKTQYRIKRTFNEYVIYSYLQFKDNKGTWRYVPSKPRRNINNQYDCYVGEQNPETCDYILFESSSKGENLKGYMKKYPYIDDYINFLINKRKEDEKIENRFETLREERRKYVEDNKYEYLNLEKNN